MRKLAVLSFLFAISCREKAPPAPAVPAGPVAWQVTASAEKAEAQVAEPFHLMLTVRHPAGADFLVPTGRSLEPFEVLERADEPVSPTETRIRLRIAAYRLPGDIAIPALKVEYQDASSKLAAVETRPIPIRLVTSLTPDVKDIHDLKGPIEEIPIPSRWNILWWLLLALLLAAIAYLLYRRFRKKASPLSLAPPAPPLPPPDLEAEAALRRLANARLLEQGRVLEFYVEISEILKRYAGRRFEVAYLERTTSEILYDLGRARVQDGWVEALSAILSASDLVKFARVQPASEDSYRILPDAFRFLDDTRPRPAPPVREVA